MNARAKLFAEFPPVSTAEWQAAIKEDLKGADLKTLDWNPEDGIAVKPFYRAEDIATLNLVETVEMPRRWQVGCAVTDTASLQEALEQGAQALIVPASLISDVPLDRVAVHVKGPATGLERFGSRIRGSVYLDPVADLSAEQAILHFKRMRKVLPGVAPFVIDAQRFHNSGATVTRELGIAMASAIACLGELSDAGIPPADIASQLIFSFGIGSNYFFEIAKLRAARLLWRRIVSAFDSAVAADIRIHAHTSKSNKTDCDPHTNLVRATTEAMSAVLGGCEMLNVETFDESPSVLSRRLAINTQLILRDEAHIGSSADPVTGCWYLEWLTDRIVHAAWKQLQSIEAEGGMRKAMAGAKN